MSTYVLLLRACVSEPDTHTHTPLLPGPEGPNHTAPKEARPSASDMRAKGAYRGPDLVGPYLIT